MSTYHLKKIIKQFLLMFPLYRKVNFQEQLVLNNFKSLQNSLESVTAHILEIDIKIEYILNNMRSDRNQVESAMQNLSQLCSSTNELINELINITSKESHKADQLHTLISGFNEKIKQLEYVNFELLPMKMHDYNNKKYKILICGYYGAPNMGDEAMLFALLNKLRACKQLDITVMFCYNKYYKINQWSDINFIHYPRNLADYVKLAESFDCIIFGGGALLDDDLINNSFMDLENVPNILILLSEATMAYKKQLVLLGLSTNTILDNMNFINRFSNIAKYASHFSVRDQLSLKTLTNAGLDVSHIDLINDIAFSIKPVPKIKTQNKILGIVLMSTYDNNKNLHIINSAIDFIKEHSDEAWAISFIPFYMYDNYDLVFYNSLIKEIDFAGVPYSIADSTRNLGAMLEAIAQCDLMICMRYHSSLFSFKQGIPAVHVIFDEHPHYPNKMLSLADMFDEKDMFIPFSKVSREKLLTLLNNKYDTYTTKKDYLMSIANQKYISSNNELEAIIETYIVKNAMSSPRL